MLEFIIMFLVFLLILVAIWVGLTKSKFGKKHFCYKDGKSLYSCGKNISVCTTNDNIENICNNITKSEKENYKTKTECKYCMEKICTRDVKDINTNIKKISSIDKALKMVKDCIKEKCQKKCEFSNSKKKIEEKLRGWHIGTHRNKM